MRFAHRDYRSTNCNVTKKHTRLTELGVVTEQYVVLSSLLLDGNSNPWLPDQSTLFRLRRSKFFKMVTLCTPRGYTCRGRESQTIQQIIRIRLRIPTLQVGYFRAPTNTLKCQIIAIRPRPKSPEKKPRPGHLTMPSLGPCCPSFWRANRLMRIFRHQLARRGKPPVRPRCHTRGNANRTHQVMAAATRPLPANASFPPDTSLAASTARPGRRSNRAAWRSCPACWREPRPCRSRPSPAPPSAA
jgi:hypothetical protein